MKIIELKTTLFEFQLDRVMGDANSPRGRTKSASCLIELITDEGIKGISIKYPKYYFTWHYMECFIHAIIHRYYIPL